MAKGHSGPGRHRLHLRHLAKTWMLTYLPPHPRRGLIPASASTTSLSTIEHLALLDLLGMPHPRVRSYFHDTAWFFDVLVNAETRFSRLRHPRCCCARRYFFYTRAGGILSSAYMRGDHLPFLHPGDDPTALDFLTLRTWNLSFGCSSQNIWGCAKRGEPSSPTQPSAPVRKSNSE
ncbi:hypothetical protein BGY98DRAFT_287956 [Russula aff. rugulosa BPL654]|nr:hypothetical protein BGY98DRAFT_287956 [Russula aff. rugulosa BPL654]